MADTTESTLGDAVRSNAIAEQPMYSRRGDSPLLPPETPIPTRTNLANKVNLFKSHALHPVHETHNTNLRFNMDSSNPPELPNSKPSIEKHEAIKCEISEIMEGKHRVFNSLVGATFVLFIMSIISSTYTYFMQDGSLSKDMDGFSLHYMAPVFAPIILGVACLLIKNIPDYQSALDNTYMDHPTETQEAFAAFIQKYFNMKSITYLKNAEVVFDRRTTYAALAFFCFGVGIIANTVAFYIFNMMQDTIDYSMIKYRDLSRFDRLPIFGPSPPGYEIGFDIYGKSNMHSAFSFTEQSGYFSLDKIGFSYIICVCQWICYAMAMCFLLKSIQSENSPGKKHVTVPDMIDDKNASFMRTAGKWISQKQTTLYYILGMVVISMITMVLKSHEESLLFSFIRVLPASATFLLIFYGLKEAVNGQKAGKSKTLCVSGIIMFSFSLVLAFSIESYAIEYGVFENMYAANLAQCIGNFIGGLGQIIFVISIAESDVLSSAVKNIANGCINEEDILRHTE